MTPAQQVKSARDELRLTTSQLASALGMAKRGYSLINKWESGKAKPNTASLQAVLLLQKLNRLEIALEAAMEHLSIEQKLDLVRFARTGTWSEPPG